MDTSEVDEVSETNRTTLARNATGNASLIIHPILRQPLDGYDLPLYGINNGQFYFIHIPALACLLLSFICSTSTIVLSFRTLKWNQFFKKWKSSEKFVVYLAICDGMFGLAHFSDHAQIAITKQHIYPRALCSAYGFVLVEFIAAQNLIVNMIAINVFVRLYFNKQLDYGRWDWRFLLWTFGGPLAGVTIMASVGHFGPTGSFCFIDRIKGVSSNTVISITPVTILTMNIVLYLLTWTKVNAQVKEIKSLKEATSSLRASHSAARVMSLFVVAFVVQWWSAAVYGIWTLAADEVPQAVHHIVTVFTNIGGILNLIVYIIIRRKRI